MLELVKLERSEIVEERLQKYLANNGIAARRKCEEFILNGRVKVNGKVVIELGTKINPDKDIIEFDGKKVEKVEKHVYILLNKPIGYVTTVKDQFDRPTVLDLVKIKEKVLPVGRLDMYTSGALMLTNDGEFINKITHPSHEVEKTFVTSPAKVKILKTDEEKNFSRLQITIHEGKNREVRKMCEAIGRKVLALHRRKIADLDVKNLEIGKWRYLTDNEVKKLLELDK